MVPLRYLQYAKDLRAQGKGKVHFLVARPDLNWAVNDMTLSINNPWTWQHRRVEFWRMLIGPGSPDISRRVSMMMR